MKIDLYFVHLLNDYSGSPRVLRDAIDAVSDDGTHQLHIISSSGSGFLSGTNAIYHKVPYHPHRNKYIQLARYLFSQVILFFLLSCLLIKSRIAGSKSIVLVNTLLPFGGHFAAKLFANKDIAYLHETHLRPKLLLLFLTKVVSLCADKTLFVSHYVKNQLDLRHHHMRVLYNGLRSDFIGIKSESLLKFNSRQVLFVGSLKAYKGIFKFVELAAKMPEFKFNAVLNASVDDFSTFESYIQEKGISNLHVFRNPTNLAQFFSEAFVVLNLSDPQQWVETFGLTLLEGMSFGTPVIAPPYGGPLELVDENVGKLIEPDALDEICGYIQELSKSYKVWLFLSQNSLMRAQNFSSEKYKSAFLHELHTNNE
ncbi:glycosyltransferase family 4 protein [Shewanella sp. A25]|nr:glycosyltransferase family 4 protein [Shewanella shenzhenensis]